VPSATSLTCHTSGVSGAEEGRSELRILLVEDRADLTHGHYLTLLQRMAAGFDALGCEVIALTSLGLPDDQPVHPAVALRRYRWVPRRIEGVLRHLDRLPRSNPWRGRTRPLVIRLRTLMLLTETRHVARSLGAPAGVGVVTLSLTCSPLYAALWAPTRGRWALFRHNPTNQLSELAGSRPSGLSRVANRALARWDRVRTSRGGRLVLVGGYQALVESWQARLPWLRTGVVELPVDSTATVADRGEARHQLGLAPAEPLALFFGAIHVGKSPATVWEAWCLHTPPMRLVAAGRGVQASIDAWVEAHPGVDTSSIHVVDGDIDDRTKELLFSATDIGVCSFRADPIGASATLTDFAAYDRPICCSGGGTAADLTRRYGLGAVFDACDPAALAEAVTTVCRQPDPAGRQAFLTDHSEKNTARALVRLLFPAGGA